MTIISLTVLVLGLTFCIWGFINNEKTYRQRIKLIPKLGHSRFWQLGEQYDKVSYNNHFWALMIFRDPFKLYDKELADYVKNRDEAA